MCLQLVRSATSIAANYQEAQAGISRADFAHKITISKKEAKETLYWLRLINSLSNDHGSPGLIKEADELVRILQAISVKLRN